MKKTFFIILGFIGLGLGIVGAAVPLLPAFPFLVLAAFGFAQGNERLHQWFINTKLYKNKRALSGPFIHLYPRGRFREPG